MLLRNKMCPVPMAEAFIISLCCSVSSRHPDKDEGIEQARRAVP